MSEEIAYTYATKSDNSPATTPNKVAVVTDADGNARQVMVLGSGDGSGDIQDGSEANPLYILDQSGNLTAIKNNTDNIPALGQGTTSTSAPVVLPASQISTLTPPAAISNFAEESGGNLAAAKTDLDAIDTATASLLNSAEGAFIQQDTNGSIAKENGGHLASLDTKLPERGAAITANSTPVTIASDQEALPLPTNAAQENNGNLALLSELVQMFMDVLSEAQFPQVAIPYGRDASDQLLVNLGTSQVALSIVETWGNNTADPIYYGIGSPGSMDAREQQELQSEINFNNVRTQRWVLT